MQGTMKVAGDMGKFLQLLPITQSREYLELQARIAPSPTTDRSGKRAGQGEDAFRGIAEGDGLSREVRTTGHRAERGVDLVDGREVGPLDHRGVERGEPPRDVSRAGLGASRGRVAGRGAQSPTRGGTSRT
jgi:hypothetical protein